LISPAGLTFTTNLTLPYSVAVQAGVETTVALTVMSATTL